MAEKAPMTCHGSSYWGQSTEAAFPLLPQLYGIQVSVLVKVF